jgi:MOSC domain-containing protein
MPRARITLLSTTPIKGFALHHPEAVQIAGSGAVGDRDFFLVDERDRLVSITRTGRLVQLRAEHDPLARRLRIRSPLGQLWEEQIRLGEPVVVDFYGDHKVAGRVVEGRWSAVLSELAGQPLRLVQADQPGAGSDVHPVTLLADESVAELARRAGVGSVDVRRFRMLIGFAGLEPFVEDRWEGRTLDVGGAVLRVGGPVPRCAATTRDPDRGDRDLPIVRMIKAHRGLQPNESGHGANLGVYASVLREGVVRLGDALVVQSARSMR